MLLKRHPAGKVRFFVTELSLHNVDKGSIQELMDMTNVSWEAWHNANVIRWKSLVDTECHVFAFHLSEEGITNGLEVSLLS